MHFLPIAYKNCAFDPIREWSDIEKDKSIRKRTSEKTMPLDYLRHRFLVESRDRKHLLCPVVVKSTLEAASN
jgi:hypothetical protein